MDESKDAFVAALRAAVPLDHVPTLEQNRRTVYESHRPDRVRDMVAAILDDPKATQADIICLTGLLLANVVANAQPPEVRHLVLGVVLANAGQALAEDDDADPTTPIA